MDQSLIDTITQLISSLGFPIFVALYFMFKVDKTLKAVTLAINELKDALYRTRLDPPHG